MVLGEGGREGGREGEGGREREGGERGRGEFTYTWLDNKKPCR